MSAPQSQIPLLQLVLICVERIFPHKLHGLPQLLGRHLPGPPEIAGLVPGLRQKGFPASFHNHQRTVRTEPYLLQPVKVQVRLLQNLADMQGKNP